MRSPRGVARKQAQKVATPKQVARHGNPKGRTAVEILAETFAKSSTLYWTKLRIGASVENYSRQPGGWLVAMLDDKGRSPFYSLATPAGN